MVAGEAESTGLAKCRRRSTIASVCAILATLAGSGCSNNPYTAGATDQSTYFGYYIDVVSFDPTVSYNTDDGALMDLVFPTFFRYNYFKRPYVTELVLGAEVPKVTPITVKAPDGKGTRQGEDWTFKLRSDICFQNDPCFANGKGRTMTAADIVFAYKRMANPALECPIKDFVDDKIVGFHDFSEAFGKDPDKSNGGKYDEKTEKHYQDPIPGVFVDPKDPFTFHVQTNQPYPQLRYLMAMHFTTPIPHEAVETYGNQGMALEHWVGCGPYRLDSYSPGGAIELVKSETGGTHEKYPLGGEKYQGIRLAANTGMTLPGYQRLHYSRLRESLTAYNLFQQGYLDMLIALGTNIQVMPAATKLTPEFKAKGAEVTSEVAPSIKYLSFNMTDPVVGGYTEEKRKLRQAISLAIDADAYCGIITQGLDVPVQFSIPAGLAGYDPNFKNPYRQFDPSLTKAKQLLAEAGYPEGISAKTHERLSITLDTYSTTPALRAMDRLFKAQIEALGVHIELKEQDVSTYTDILHKRRYQFCYYSWVADYPDPENFLQLFYSPNWEPGPSDTLYKQPAYDAMFEKMRNMRDGPERLAIIYKMRDMLVNDCPQIFICAAGQRNLVQNWVSGVKAFTVGNDYNKYPTLDVEKRKKLQQEWNQASYAPLFAAFAIVLVALTPAYQVVNRRRNRRVRRASSGGASGGTA